MGRALQLFVALLAASAGAQARLDHERAVGLLLDAGGGASSAIAPGSADVGPRALVDVGLTWGATERLELLLGGRLSLGGSAPDGAVLAGVRLSYSLERWKTFVDGAVITHVRPLTTVGARAGFGVMYEVSSVFGVYALIGGEAGGGQGLRLGFDAALGVQLRSWLFD